MKYRYKLSTRFQKEYLKIVDYIIDNFGKQYALDFSETVHHKLLEIVDNPEIASSEPLLDDRETLVRSKIVSKHNKAIYYVKGDTVFFTDLWDMRREPQKLANRIKLK